MSRLKFIIISRLYYDLESAFGKFSIITIYVRFDRDEKSDEISNDINLVIDDNIYNIAGDLATKDRLLIF
jgi:hypothetical protein